MKPALLAGYPADDVRLLGRGRAVVDADAAPPRLIARTAAGVSVRELAGPSAAFGEPGVLFPGHRSAGEFVGNRPVAGDLSLAVLMDDDAYHCVTRDGDSPWSRPRAGSALGYVHWTAFPEVPGFPGLPDGEQVVWLAIGGRDGDIALCAFDQAGDRRCRLAVPFGDEVRRVRLETAGGVPVALTIERKGVTTTFRIDLAAQDVLLRAPLCTGRAVLGTSPAGARWASTGRTDSGTTTDVRWHRPGGEVAGGVTLDHFAGGGTDPRALHHAPYLSDRIGGFVTEDLLLVGLEDDYDEAEVELLGAAWQPYSHWLIDLAAAGRPVPVDYPDGYGGGDGFVAVLGDGTWLTVHDDTLHRWSATAGSTA